MGDLVGPPGKSFGGRLFGENWMGDLVGPPGKSFGGRLFSEIRTADILICQKKYPGI